MLPVTGISNCFKDYIIYCLNNQNANLVKDLIQLRLQNQALYEKYQHEKSRREFLSQAYMSVTDIKNMNGPAPSPRKNLTDFSIEKLIDPKEVEGVDNLINNKLPLSQGMSLQSENPAV